MPFRSLATLQGGTAADIADTPGEPAGTRFVGFGENLTSAISNRPHYALAENTDDLNTRLVSWETGGLDSAYDLGAAAVPGGGRDIVLDSGAIETYTNAANSLESDVANAHFRAFMDDDEAIGVGLDAKAGSFGAFAGVLLRHPLVLGGGTNTPNTSGACTLNPSGAGVALVALDAGSFNTSGESALMFGYDLIEISGTASDDGLYVIWDIGGADDRVLLRHLNGLAPSFPADEAGTCQVFRALSYQGDAQSGTVGKQTTKFFGHPGERSTVDIYPGMYSYAEALGTGVHEGADSALRTFIRDESGNGHIESLEIDWAGVLRKKAFRGDLPADDQGLGGDGNLFAGAFTFRDMTYDSGGFEVSHVVGKFGGTIVDEPVRYDFMSLVPSNLLPFAGEDLEYFADSPTGGVINLPSAVAGYANTVDAMAGIVVYIRSGAGMGFYRIVDRNDSAPDQLVLRNLDGTLPSHFPTSGVSTFRTFAYSGIGGPGMVFSVDTVETAQNGSWALQASAAGEFTALDAIGATSLALYAGQDNVLGTGAFLRGYNGFGADGVQEVVRLDKDGNLFTRGNIELVGTREVNYEPSRSKTLLLDPSYWQPKNGTIDTNKWVWGVSGWVTQEDNVILTMPLNRLVAQGSVITQIELLNNGTSDPATFKLKSRTPNFGTPAALVDTLEADDVAGGTSPGWHVLTLAGSWTMDGTTLYYLEYDSDTPNAGTVTASAVRVTYTDPGPRNN